MTVFRSFPDRPDAAAGLPAPVPATSAPPAPRPASVPAAPRRRANQGGGGVPGGIAGAFAYDAANLFGQEMAEWLPWLRSPDGELNGDRDRIVARARDLDRNDGWAKGAKTRLKDTVVGSQFRLVAKPDYRALMRECPACDVAWAHEFRAAVEAEWRMWAEDGAFWCDATRTGTMTQLFRMAFGHGIGDGDALGVLLWAPDSVGYGAARYATTLQVVDPDRLSNPNQQQDTAALRGGVEVDAAGAALAYHVRRAHQNDLYLSLQAQTWDRLPRETPWGRPVVVHAFDRERAGGHRGVPVMAPVLARMRMLTRYDVAELQQALLQTIFGTFIESPYDTADVQAAMEGESELSTYQQLRKEFHEENTLTLGGVRIPHLAPGEKLNAVNATRPNSGFDAFQSTFLRNLAAATGQSAEQVTWDYSKTNYSSARAAMLEAWKTTVRRRDDFATSFANPVFRAFLEEVVDRGRAPLPQGAPDFAEWRTAYARCRWIGPARGWVDPVAERQGAVLGLDAGFGTLEQECADQGLDYEETLDQRALEVRMMDVRGLPRPEWARGAPAGAASQKPGAK